VANSHGRGTGESQRAFFSTLLVLDAGAKIQIKEPRSPQEFCLSLECHPHAPACGYPEREWLHVGYLWATLRLYACGTSVRDASLGTIKSRY